MAELRLKNLTKRFGSYVGVDNFNLDIADQEFIVLLGPSGCGKTTTMRMIAGLEEVSEGEIWLGRMVNKLEPKDRDISMVFRATAVSQHDGLREHPFPCASEGAGGPAQRTGVAGRAHGRTHRPPRPAAGGALGRPAPARGFRPRHRARAHRVLNGRAAVEFGRQAARFPAQIKNLQHTLKTTTVYVTHDQIEAMTLADRVVVMNKG